jgi:hypothetical protein
MRALGLPRRQTQTHLRPMIPRLRPPEPHPPPVPSATPTSRRSIPRYCNLRHRESAISPSRRSTPVCLPVAKKREMEYSAWLALLAVASLWPDSEVMVEEVAPIVLRCQLGLLWWADTIGVGRGGDEGG